MKGTQPLPYLLRAQTRGHLAGKGSESWAGSARPQCPAQAPQGGRGRLGMNRQEREQPEVHEETTAEQHQDLALGTRDVQNGHTGGGRAEDHLEADSLDAGNVAPRFEAGHEQCSWSGMSVQGAPWGVQKD